MPQIDALKHSAAEFTSAALLGEGWEHFLSCLSRAAGARGAVIMRNRKRVMVSVIASEDVQEQVADYRAGRAPPNSRQVRASHEYSKGFRLDHDDYTPEEMARDPYYQEFLRPNGFFWHANVRLDDAPGEEIALSLKRGISAGPFERADQEALNSILPELRAATRIARRVLDSETAGMVRLLHQRGDPMFELDAWGRVLRAHMSNDDRTSAIQVMRDRLVAADRLAQPRLERGVAMAVASPGTPAMIPLPDTAGGRYFLQIVPVGGRARDIFLAAAAVAVLIDLKPRHQVGYFGGALRDAFALTDREVDVALMLGDGLSPAEIAGRLRIQVDTVRDHLKNVFGKTSTSRQAELTALLARLRS
jgi:DNA-binding CsgD family transcriptional regulator